MAPRTKHSSRRTPVLRRIAAATVALAIVSGGAIASQAATAGDGVDRELVAAVDGVPGSQAAAVVAEESPDSIEADAYAAPSGFAHIDVNVGGLRTLGTVTGVDPLAGATFQLHTAVYSSSDFKPGEPISWAWATATSGERGDVDDGVARFVVPIVTATGGSYQVTATSSNNNGRVYENGATVGSRFFIVQTGIEGDDWSTNATLRTGSTSAGASSRTTPYDFLTAGIASGGRQVSGHDFMNASGFNRSDWAPALASSSPSSATRTQSGGIWQNTLANPALPPQCGIDVALVVDMSSSVGSANRPTMTGAAQAFVNALTGTPSRISSYSFGWAAPSTSVPTDAHLTLQSVASESGRQAFATAFDRWRAGSDGGTDNQATNWNRGFAQVAEANAGRVEADQYDVVFFITDGNPTWYEDGTGTGGVNNRLRDVEEGIFSANLVKSQGTRVVAVGVGGPNFLDDISMANLHAVSGPQLFNATAGSDGQGILDADVIRVTEWERLASALSRFALEGCTPSLNVNKVEAPRTAAANITVPADQVGVPAVTGGVDGAGWNITAELGDGTLGFVSSNSDEMTATTDESGAVSFPLDVSPGEGTTRVRITEEQQRGWDLITQGEQNAFCSYRTFADGNLAEGRVSITDSGVENGDPWVEFDMHPNWMVSCQFVNRAPAPLTAVATAGGTYDTGWSWALDKSSTRDDETVTLVPGTTLPVKYTLDVTATPTDASFTASGTVVVSNPHDDEMPLGDVQVLVNGEPAVLSGPAQVEANSSVELGWERTFGSTDPRPLSVLVTIDGVDQPSTVGTFTGEDHNRMAVLVDIFADAVLERFPGLVDHFDAITLDVDGWRDQEGAVEEADTPTWQFVYERKLGPLNAGETFEFTNHAILTPEDGDPIEDETTTTLVTREDLAVAADVTVEAQRTFDWSIDKLVRVAGSDDVWGPSAGPVVEGADGTREFEYQLVVTPGPISDSSFTVTFDGIEVTNPNPVDVTLTSITPTVTIDGAVPPMCLVVEQGPWVVPATTASGNGVATFTVECGIVEGATADTLRAGDFGFDVEIAWDGEALGSPASAATAMAPDDVEVAWDWSFTNDVVRVYDDKTTPDATPAYLGSVHWLHGVLNPAWDDAEGADNEDIEQWLGWADGVTPRAAHFVYDLTVGVGTHPNVAWLAAEPGDGAPEDEDHPWVDDAVVIVEPRLAVDVTVHGANHVDHDWAITKIVTSDDDVETVAGEDVEFAYLITVTSDRQVENLYVTGWFDVTNSASEVAAIDGLTVMVGDTVAVLGEVPDVVGSEAVRVEFTATLDGELVDAGDPLPVVATVTSHVFGEEFTDADEAELTSDDVTRTVTNQTAEVRDSFPEFAAQFGDANGEVWLDAADPEANEAWNTEAGRWEFAYTAERGATVPDGGIESFVNVATVIPDPGTPPGDGWEDDQPAGDLEDDAVVIVRTPVVYDLALRSWIAELHRPGVGRISERLPSDLYPDTSGPEQPVPYVAYDNPYADVQVGDIMVSNIRVFNQGNRTARVDELVKYTYPGLALASPLETEIVPGHENYGWAIGASGDAYRTFAEGGIVLAPGEELTVHVTQVVTSELFEEDGVEVVYDADGRPFREVLTFTEISSFSGWLHDEPVIATRDPLIAAFAASEMHDGVAGSWVMAEPGGLVEDIDSIPGTADHRVPFDETSVRWVDMEIHHSVGEQDEDDHDGAVIRVLDPEFVANELPAPAPEGTPTPDGTPAPDGTPTPDGTPGLDATDPDVRAATGGTALDGSGRVLLALAAAGLMVLAGLVLRRTRSSRAG